MSKNIFYSLTLLFVICFNIFFVFSPALAQIKADVVGGAMKQIDAGANSIGYSAPKDVRVVIINILKGVLSVLGTIFLAVSVYGGYTYFTSHGVDEKIEKGKNTITMAIIGIVIVLISYGIVAFVSKSILEVTSYGRLY